MGRRLENTSAFMNLAASGNPGEIGMRIVGFHGMMKKSDSQLNLEAFLCMSSEGEGECPDGILGIKEAHISDKTPGDFLQGKSPSDHALGGGLVDDPGSKDDFSSCGQPTKLGWCPSPAVRGSSPASTGGSGFTFGCKNSGEQSDEDDDMETEAGQCEESVDGSELKRMRRMVSNRESARRSRRRKQAHLNELESQVDQLRGENSSLFKQLTEISQRCKEAAGNNLVLKSDVEALRATMNLRSASRYHQISSASSIYRDRSTWKPPKVPPMSYFSQLVMQLEMPYTL
ncbi:bZIP transcription factor RISBZ5-like isoform X2 [Nymphaea colorata]|uniref:bZIP transcription factor RISBZ5-like isoform X2 n=1 Tax=Nymphaea colorata TaxID=210225 RepID=UPI00129DC616|nr:bZIP transcription factor RISBZ5-like isoform X2 [Nymphaea colorata]